MKKNIVNVVPYCDEDFVDVLDMATKLFQELSRKELSIKLKKITNTVSHQTYMAKKDAISIGFIIVSIRNDYVEGATTSPTGYLEAIYVQPQFQNQGIAKFLFEKGETWAYKRGCTEIGSDTWEWNTAAQKFHTQLGFKKEEVLVHYIKSIEPQ